MQIVYVGPHLEGVEIAESGQVAHPGMPVEVEDGLAARLLEQASNWQPVDTKQAKGPAENKSEASA